MTVEVTTIRGVRANYGTREVGGGMGVIKTEGTTNELTIDLDAASISGDAWADVVVPAGSIVTAAYIEVFEAFNLGGTTPTIAIGETGAEVTNGIVVSEAIAEAIGTADLIGAAAGEWDPTSAIPHDQVVGVALGGTTPVFTTTVGRARVVITYRKLGV